MTHPAASDLALFAGGELALLRRWSVGRHVSRCEHCRAEVAAFDSARQRLAASAGEMPSEVNWSRLAAEMKANIHVGLAAGECVGPIHTEPLRIAWRTAATLAPVTLVLLAGWWLLPSRPDAARGAKPEGVVLEATADGIELREGGRVFALQHPGSGDVTYTVDAGGTLRASYVDSETGQVTINNVYAE